MMRYASQSIILMRGIQRNEGGYRNIIAACRNRHDYYRFNGSLTTPPCSEGVWWFVMKYFDTASKEQIEKFAHTMHHDNNRPLQAINARMILE